MGRVALVIKFILFFSALPIWGLLKFMAQGDIVPLTLPLIRLTLQPQCLFWTPFAHIIFTFLLTISIIYLILFLLGGFKWVLRLFPALAS